MVQAAAPAAPADATPVSSAGIPAYLWVFVAAVVSVVIGGSWDISWHATVGRDTFWTPAHVLIYLCGLLGGGGAAWLILGGAFGSVGRAATVRMWGFRGPLGAFLAAWGGAAMLVSAPFDNWWHEAYGLDVKILSPPHMVLILGVIAVKFGALLLILGERNRATGRLRSRLELLFLAVSALLVRDMTGVLLEYTSVNQMHSARFYLVVSASAPLGLTAFAWASARRWAATEMAAVIMAVGLAFLWILPLFPAEPKLGPVYRQVTHFIPVGGFPLLWIVPALALDLLRQRALAWRPWKVALAGGSLFLAAFLGAQWPFATFLNSPGARNWFFGAHYAPYFAPPNSDFVRHVFSRIEPTPQLFWIRMAIALCLAVLGVRLGLACSQWMLRLRR